MCTLCVYTQYAYREHIQSMVLVMSSVYHVASKVCIYSIFYSDAYESENVLDWKKRTSQYIMVIHPRANYLSTIPLYSYCSQLEP
jgi:lipopolysaccharide biosynthesis protein